MTDRNEKKEQMMKKIKKGAAISLCAVLAGGLTFQGIDYLRGWSQAANVQAAVDENDGITLVKSEKTTDSGSDSSEKGNLDVSDIVENVMPSVVSISTKSVQEVQDYFGMFSQYGYGYAPEEREVEGSGSGIIVGKNDSELLVVTNYHVVEDATTLSVCFIDGEAYEGKVKGYDSSKDLAVVAVPLDDISSDTKDEITVATIGSSDDMKVGEQVIAIGNALGYGQSVTTGIVSAKNRRADSSYAQTVPSEDSEDEDNESGINLIQTDAAINPGNSGGALLNMNGEVIGINSAKLASTEVEGIGYAIAISDVSDVLENLMNEETRDKVADGNHGVLGIKGSTVSQEGIQIYGIPEGVFVAEVTEGGAADDAGMQQNSVITKFDGKTVTAIDELVGMLEYYEPGEKVEVTVEVPDGNSYKEETLTVKLDKNTDTEEENNSQNENSQEEEQDDNSEEGESLFKDWEDNFKDGNNW